MPQDTLHAVDSVIELEDCYDHFFQQSERVVLPVKIMLVKKNGKTVSLKSFLNINDKDNFPIVQPQYGLADLDNDGKKELVIYNFTGGAHCCDEFYFYKNIAPNKYQHAAKTFAGNVCITNKNKFTFSFYEQFGYFFTCYACEYEDTSDTAPQPVHSILLKYFKGKLRVVPGDKELRSVIIDNLGKLGEQPYQKLQDEIDQDKGVRKELALNLAVFYYSFGEKWIETKKLFDKYYRFPDAKKVWAAFVQILNEIRKENDF
jgi:hypothetical protein